MIKHIIVEGVDRVGKTTLINSLHELMGKDSYYVYSYKQPYTRHTENTVKLKTTSLKEAFYLFIADGIIIRNDLRFFRTYTENAYVLQDRHVFYSSQAYQIPDLGLEYEQMLYDVDWKVAEKTITLIAVNKPYNVDRDELFDDRKRKRAENIYRELSTMSSDVFSDVILPIDTKNVEGIFQTIKNL